MAYLPVALKVEEIRQDSPNLKTYVFKRNLRAKPGQFVMVWVPGVDEVPMSIGWQDEEEVHIGIADAGDCTHLLHEKIKVGDKLGIRGPYGSVFNLPEGAKKIVVIGGGYGTPPMLSLAQDATAKGIEVIAIIGARSKDYIIYEDWFKKLGCEVKLSTDDGSAGHKGYSTEVLEKVLEEEKIDGIYTCGPELMMVNVAKQGVAKDIYTEVSLERYMKCGFGACGQCCMDNTGIRICKEGPVLEAKYALEHPEFGKYTRGPEGIIEEM